MSPSRSSFPGESRGPAGEASRLHAPAWASQLDPRLRRGTLVFAAALALTTTALADSSLPPAPLANVQLADPAKEAQAKALMATIRCLVCQGESIADSNAELAGDMRSLVRQRIQAGEKPEAVRAWLVSRYGKWVSYDPPLDSTTFALWAAPVLFLLIGIVIAGGTLRRRKQA